MKKTSKEKAKKIAYKTLKIIWIIIGFFIALITGLLYIRMYSAQGLGVIGLVMLFAVGVYALFVYVGITLLFLLIRWLIKKFKKIKLRKNN